MPHIIVEYAEEALEQFPINEILMSIHNSITDSGLFKANQIRTRAYPFRHFTNAGGSDPFIHIQARIKSGRDTENKKQLGEVILSGVKQLEMPISVVSVEIIDMDRDSYGKLA